MKTLKMKLIKKLVYTSVIMLWFALSAGVFYREFTKFELKNVPADKALIATEFIRLVHGHTITFGFLIPLGFALMLILIPEVNEKTYRSFLSAFWTYIIGAAGAILLLLWKGIDYVRFFASDPSITLDKVESMLFGGSKALRASLYGIFHLAFGIGLIWLSIIVLKSLKSEHQRESSGQ